MHTVVTFSLRPSLCVVHKNELHNIPLVLSMAIEASSLGDMWTWGKYLIFFLDSPQSPPHDRTFAFCSQRQHYGKIRSPSHSVPWTITGLVLSSLESSDEITVTSRYPTAPVNLQLDRVNIASIVYLHTPGVLQSSWASLCLPFALSLISMGFIGMGKIYLHCQSKWNRQTKFKSNHQ